MRLHLRSLALVVSLAACVGPADRSRAEERVAMEEAQAAIIHGASDCGEMSHRLAQWYADDREAIDANDAWWNDLGETRRSLASAGLGERSHAAFGERMGAIIRCGEVAWFSDRTSLGDPALTPIAVVPAGAAPVDVPAFVASTGATPAPSGAALAADALPIPITAPRRGASSPRVVVHVFSEFESPFCQRIAPTLDRLMIEYGDRVLLVFRHSPLPFHRHSEPAARAAMEVRAQLGDGAFWAYHDVLFAHHDALADEDLVRYAASVPGIDLPRFQTALATHAHSDEVAADRAAASALGYAGTPTLRIGATVVRGAQPYDALRTAIEAELAR
jgi:protein-disulfide isomerase